MKLFVIIILTHLITSCAGEEETISSRPREVIKISLIDSLGFITMEQPPNTDTFFSWVRRNDCGKPCEEGRYRFQPTAYPIFKESGFFFINEPDDSVLQLTILHSRNVYLKGNNTDFALKYRDWLREIFADQIWPLRIVSDTTYLIGDRHYSIFGSSGYDSHDSAYVMRLDAFTSVKGNKIQFSYQAKMKDSGRMLDNFLIESERNLRTTRFHDGG